VNIQNVIDKVRKLRQLATSSNPHEAEAAARAAERLITEHKIAEAELEAEAPGAREPIIQDGLAMIVDGDKWKSHMLFVLAKHYDVTNYYTTLRRKAKRVTLIGRASDIATVKYQYSYFVMEIERLTRVSGYRGRSALNAFRVGASIGIQRAIGDSKKAVMQDASTSTAMVLVGRYAEAEAERDRLHPDLRTNRVSLTATDRDAYGDGIAQGRGVAQREARARMDGKGTRALPEGA
jgi:Protein of unknown function (DUF2786)